MLPALVCIFPFFAKPSIVVILEPFKSAAKAVQLLIDLPSTWTTHAPHWLVSQPMCVPVKFKNIS